MVLFLFVCFVCYFCFVLGGVLLHVIAIWMVLRIRVGGSGVCFCFFGLRGRRRGLICLIGGRFLNLHVVS